MLFNLCQFRILKGHISFLCRKNVFSNYSILHNTLPRQSIRNIPFIFRSSAKHSKVFATFATKTPKKPIQKELRRLLQVAKPQKWKLTGFYVHIPLSHFLFYNQLPTIFRLSLKFLFY